MNQRGQESAELNIRNLDPQLVEQVRIAAVRRGGRAALRTWVSMALARQLRIEAGPKPAAARLKLCAHCFRVNQELMKQQPAPPRMALPVELAGTVEVAGPEAVQASTAIARLLEKVNSEASGAAPLTDVPLMAPSRAAIKPSAAETATGSQPSPFHSKRMPVEVHPGLWVGSDEDYETLRGLETESLGWSFLQAAKEPWHRTLVGYQTRSAPEGPERLAARRGNLMALNLIDVHELGPGGERYVPEAVIEAAMGFLTERLAAGDQVLVHSSRGTSRAPGLAMLYLQRHGLLPAEYQAAHAVFVSKYPAFAPGAGMAAYLAAQTPAIERAQ